MSLERRRFFQAAGLGAAASLVAAPAVAQSLPEVKWRLTSSFPKTLDTLFGGARVFAEAVAEATSGKFQIQIHPAGEIVPGIGALDAVQSGTVEVCQTALYYYWNKDPTYGFATAVPFGMNSRQQAAWFYHGGGNELFNEFLKDGKCIAMPAGNTGCQMGGWFRKELKTVSDLNGLKIRIGGFAGKVFQRLGAVPQQTGSSELRQALESGKIDAATWVTPYDDEKLGLVKAAPYYYYPGWWDGGTAVHLVFNLAKWDELPKAYQSILTTAAAMANGDMLARYDANNPAALKRLVGAGAKLKSYPQDLLGACYKASSELYAEIAEGNPKFKKMWDAYSSFRNDQYLWWQVAEYTYDNFMIRERAKG